MTRTPCNSLRLHCCLGTQMLCCKLQPQNRLALTAHSIACTLHNPVATAADILLLIMPDFCGLAIFHAASVHIGKAIWYLPTLGCNSYTQSHCSILADSKISKEEMGSAGASCCCSLQHRSNCESVHASSSAAVLTVPGSIPTAATSVTACVP